MSKPSVILPEFASEHSLPQVYKYLKKTNKLWVLLRVAQNQTYALVKTYNNYHV